MPARVAVLVAALLVAGCGSSKSSAPRAGGHTTTASATAPARTTRGSAPSALQAEATSAATGDIPDNQVFIRFHDAASAYSMKYPEGWAQQGTGARVTFRDKNNIVRVLVTRSAPPTATSIRADLGRLRGVRLRSGPQPPTIPGARAFEVVYTTDGQPDAAV